VTDLSQQCFDQTPLREFLRLRPITSCFVAEMIAHLRLERGLQYSLCQLAEQPLGPTSSMPFSRAWATSCSATTAR
jgi:hypothetical protein